MSSSQASINNGAASNGKKVSGLKKTASLKFKSLRGKPSVASKPPTDVPSGTVASRVSYLHSLAASSHNIASSAQYPPPLKGSEHARSVQKQLKRGSEDDRGGYGRRTSSKFGYPAHRSGEPQEDPAPEESRRKRFRDWRKKPDDEIGELHEKERRLRQKVKRAIKHEREEESPATPFYGQTPRTSVSVKSRAQELEEATKSQISPSISPTRAAPFAILLPSHIEDVQPEPDYAQEELSPDHKIKAWLAEAGPSTHTTVSKSSEKSGENSEATTSTYRVRSVQQLYSSHGIEEPPELFAGRPPSTVQDNSEAQRQCHVCTWLNGEAEAERCACCGHRLCGQCVMTKPTKDSLVSKMDVPFAIYEDVEEDATPAYLDSRPEIASEVFNSSVFDQENWPKHLPTSNRPRHISSRQSPTARNNNSLSIATLPLASQRTSFELAATQPLPLSIGTSRKTTESQVPPDVKPSKQHELSDPVPETSPSTPSTLPRVVRRPASPPTSVSKASPELSAVKKRSMVKYSPFLRADQGSPTKPPLRRFKKSVMMGIQRTESDKMILEERSVASIQPTVSPQVSNECDSIGCKATHTGHRPYRHSISCTWKRSQAGQGSRLDVSTPPTDFPLSLEDFAALVPKPLTPRHTMDDEDKAGKKATPPALQMRSFKAVSLSESESVIHSPVRTPTPDDTEDVVIDTKQASVESEIEESSPQELPSPSTGSLMRRYALPDDARSVSPTSPVVFTKKGTLPPSKARDVSTKPQMRPESLPLSPNRVSVAKKEGTAPSAQPVKKTTRERNVSRHHHRRKEPHHYTATPMSFLPPMYSHHVLHTIQYIECLGHSKSRKGVKRYQIPIVRRPKPHSGDYYCEDESCSNSSNSRSSAESSSQDEALHGMPSLRTTPKRLNTDFNPHDGSHDGGELHSVSSPPKSSPLRSVTEAMEPHEDYSEDFNLAYSRANIRSPIRSPSPLITGHSRFVENLDESMPGTVQPAIPRRNESPLKRLRSLRSPRRSSTERHQQQQSPLVAGPDDSTPHIRRSSRTMQMNEGRVNHLANFWASRTNTMSPPLQRSNAMRRQSKVEEEHDSQESEEPPILHRPPEASAMSESELGSGTQASTERAPRKLQKRLKVHGSRKKPKNFKLGRHVVERARAQSPRPQSSGRQTPVPKLMQLKDQLIAAGSKVQSAVPSRTVTRRRKEKRSVYEASPSGYSESTASATVSRQEVESFSVVQHYSSGQAGHDGPAESSAGVSRSSGVGSRQRQMPGSWTEEMDADALVDLLELYATSAV